MTDNSANGDLIDGGNGDHPNLENAKEDMKDAAEDTGEAVKDAAENTGDAMRDTGRAIRDGVTGN